MADRTIPKFVLQLDEKGNFLKSAQDCAPNDQECRLRWEEIPHDKQDQFVEEQVKSLLSWRSNSSDPAWKEKCGKIGVSGNEIRSYPSPDSSGIRRILIYVHGGLNTQQNTVERAKEFYLPILCSGHYPLFVNWRSSLISSYLEHILFVRQGKRLPWYHYAALPFSPIYLAIDLARGALRAPFAFGQLVRNDFEGSIFYENHEIKEIVQDIRREPKNNAFSIQITDLPESVPFDFDTFYSGITWLVTLPTKIVLTPFIDAMGASAWKNMVRRTHILYNNDEEFDIHSIPAMAAKAKISKDQALRNSAPNLQGLSRIDADGGLSRFFRKLLEEAERSQLNLKDEAKFEFTLIGHSMGTLIINQLLRDYGRKLNITRIVYLGAASSIRDYQDSVWPHLKDGRAKFYNLMLHEKAEAQDFFTLPVFPFEQLRLDLGPRGSLLVWADSFLTDPETLLDRVAGRFTNVVPAIHLTPPDLRNRVAIRVFKKGARNQPQHHQGFNDSWKFWKEECWEPNIVDWGACVWPP